MTKIFGIELDRWIDDDDEGKQTGIFIYFFSFTFNKYDEIFFVYFLIL